MNPVIYFILVWRARGKRHSDMDWAALRLAYDYTQEVVSYADA